MIVNSFKKLEEPPADDTPADALERLYEDTPPSQRNGSFEIIRVKDPDAAAAKIAERLSKPLDLKKILKKQPEPGVLDGLVSQADFAAQVGKTLRTIARWRDLRKDPVPTKIGSSVYYTPEAIEAWKRERQEKRGRRVRRN